MGIVKCRSTVDEERGRGEDSRMIEVRGYVEVRKGEGEVVDTLGEFTA